VIFRPHSRKKNQRVMNLQPSTSISGKHHPENARGEGAKGQTALRHYFFTGAQAVHPVIEDCAAKERSCFVRSVITGSSACADDDSGGFF